MKDGVLGGWLFKLELSCPLCGLRHNRCSVFSVQTPRGQPLQHGSEGVRMHTNCHVVVGSFLFYDMGNLCAFVDLPKEA